jgi:hypothetical protein
MLPLITSRFYLLDDSSSDDGLSDEKPSRFDQLDRREQVERWPLHSGMTTITYAAMIAFAYLLMWLIFGLWQVILGALVFSVVCAVILVILVYRSDLSR